MKMKDILGPKRDAGNFPKKRNYLAKNCAVGQPRQFSHIPPTLQHLHYLHRTVEFLKNSLKSKKWQNSHEVLDIIYYSTITSSYRMRHKFKTFITFILIIYFFMTVDCRSSPSSHLIYCCFPSHHFVPPPPQTVLLFIFDVCRVTRPWADGIWKFRKILWLALFEV
jgi:hypothetical protein